jgi:MoxR-like ATPase
VATTVELSALQKRCRESYVDPALNRYAVRLVAATRDPARYGIPDVARFIACGASPRASIHLIEAARALALLRGRDYALAQDVADLAPDVLRHRLALTYEAVAEAVTPDALIGRLLDHVTASERTLDDARIAAGA